MPPSPPPAPASTDLGFDPASLALVDLPVAWTDAGGGLLGANAAFVAQFGPADAVQPLQALLAARLGPPPDGGAALQAALAARQPAAVDWPGPARPAWQLRLRPAGARAWVVTLQPAPAPAPAADAAPPSRLADLLRTAQTLGRIGVWERDLRSGQGLWDDHVWRFWGLPPRPEAPSMPEAEQAVHPDDREALRQRFRQSADAPGHHEHRYRLRGADGRLRHMCSRWQVCVGGDGRPERVLGIEIDETEVRQLAQSADDAHAQLHLAATLAGIAEWQHDAASDRLQTSAAGWALLGLPARPGGATLQELAPLLHPEDLASVLAQYPADAARGAAAGADGTTDIVVRVRDARDGRDGWRYLMARSVPRRAADGALLGHVGVALDMTGRLEAQRHALDLAQHLEMATAAAGLGIWTLTADSGHEMHWDLQMRRLHGLPPDAPAPRPGAYVRGFVHPEDRAAVDEAMHTLRQRHEGLIELDVRVIWPDGQQRRLATRSSMGMVGGRRRLHGVMLDVTERHLAENRLREAQQRAALVARSVGIGTWASDADARVGWWDEQMFALRGRPPRSTPVTVEEMMTWVHAEDRERHQRLMAQALQDNVATNTEFRVLWPDGSERWLASRSIPVRDDSGRTVRRIGINWDITDARNAAAARAEQLLAQRESQAKSRFLARISHELRTPLNAVLGFSQLLLAETSQGGSPDPQTWRRRAAQVQASGEHLLALIDDVLELSSLQSGELPMSLQPVALAPLVASALSLVELQARQAGVALHADTPQGWVLGDPVRLRQVLLNLLSNAIKYNRAGGRVTVSAAVQDGWQLLRVSDTGRGMDEQQLQHLFEPFNRLGAEREGIAGTGIGLAIVRAAVQQMGGTVQVRSRPGEGSCFEVSLQQAAAAAPAELERAAAAAPVPAAAPAAVPAGLTDILYIEDNPVNLLIVRELLGQRADLRFAAAEDGRSGLAAARAQRPALILLDMQLPDMDGLAVLQALRADPQTAGIRCVALSANAMPEDIRRARAAGFDDYWTKPLDLRGFLGAMDHLFGPAPGAA